MTFVDGNYITMARKSEIMHHERKVLDLNRQIRHLKKALAREKNQHHARLSELQRVEEHLIKTAEHTIQSIVGQPTLKPLPSSIQKWTQVRKHTRHMAPNSSLRIA